MHSFGGTNLWRMEKQDLPDHYLWANDDNLRRLMGGPPRPRSTWELEQWLQTTLSDPRQELYSVKASDARHLGWCQLSELDFVSGNAKVGLMIRESEWRKGYGHDALIAIARYCFLDLRFHRLEAEILSINKPSLNLFEKVGFIQEGLKRHGYFSSGRFLDVALYGLLNGELKDKKAKSKPEGP